MTRANLHYKNRPKIMSFFLKNLSEGYLQGTQSDLTDICENAQSAVLQASFKVTCRQNIICLLLVLSLNLEEGVVIPAGQSR